VKVIEKNNHRTRLIKLNLNQPMRHGTLLLTPRACIEHPYPGNNLNIALFIEISLYPYSVVLDEKRIPYVEPTLVFSSYISTLSPTFIHPDFEIIPVKCPTNTPHLQYKDYLLKF
jgi:hypothetical protein